MHGFNREVNPAFPSQRFSRVACRVSWVSAFDHYATNAQNLKEHYKRTGVSDQESKDQLTTMNYRNLRGSGERSTNRMRRSEMKHLTRMQRCSRHRPGTMERGTSSSGSTNR